MGNEFALILLDISMPGMDGFETAAMIHDHPRFERTPIIFVTGVHDTEFDRLKGYKLGAVDYVSVPVVPEILRSKVYVLIELHCKRRDLQRVNRTLADANSALAEANATLQMEKARELQALNAHLQSANSELKRSNEALQAEITQRNRIEAALKEADRRKDEFLAILAHELRNPLAALSAAAHLLARKGRSEAVTAMASTTVKRQVEHMARLLDDLLDVSRISHGRMQLQFDTLDANEIVRSAAEMMRPQIEAKQQTLSVAVEQTPAAVLADGVRLIQIVANLLNNAVKYTPAGGHIDVRVTATTDKVCVSVRDNGVGISQDALERIFDMFFQHVRPASDGQGGLGVGLTLVRGLVQLHKGSVHALSQGEGLGSEFVVTLPRADDTVTVQALPNADSAETIRPLRILVADDNVDNATSWSALIEESGHKVVTAHDGRAALELAESFRPEVILLDIGMPHMDGYEVAQRIRSRDWGSQAVLIAVTGWGQAKDRAMASAAGFDEHFTKPLDPSQLARALRNASRRLDGA
jgi:signal transduction histidine kinase/ActR/RegA family two-component response regulator